MALIDWLGARSIDCRMPSTQPFSVAGKVALITGASSGFGKHFAKVLAREGAKVGLAARRVDVLQSLAQEIRDAGGLAAVAQLDYMEIGRASCRERV